MGYRSEVAFVVKRSAFNDMWKIDPVTMAAVTEYADSVTKCEDSVLVLWNDIKWYTDTEIGKFENLMNNLENDDYHFLRLGEDYNDSEEQGGYWDNPFDTRISRSLDYSSKGEPLNLDVFR